MPVKKILVTGGTGFIGNYLVEELARKGFHCRCLVRESSDISNLKQFTDDFVYGDITDGKSLKGIAEGVDLVYHLAGSGHVSAVSEKAYRQFADINLKGTENLLKECLDHSVDRFVHFSSTAAMGLIKGTPVVDEKTPCKPETPYQKSKYKAEEIVFDFCRTHGLQGIVVRPCMVYGPGGKGEFLKFCRLMKKGLFPKVGSGRNLTPLVHVNDVVQGAIKAGLNGKQNNVYLLTSPTSIEMDLFRNLVLSELKIKRPYIYVPEWVAMTAALLLENIAKLTRTTPYATVRNIDSTITDRVFSIDKAKNEIDYRPQIEFSAGIAETIKWFLSKNSI